MPRLDLSPANPDDLNNLDLEDARQPPPGTTLERHPYVRKLLRRITELTDANQQLVAIQNEMLNRDLLAARHLEPVNQAPLGLIHPVAGLPTIVHVDALRLLVNRVRGVRDPTIRILAGGLDATPQHCHELRLGPSELVERYEQPLPGRSSALVVLYTHAPVEVTR